MDTEDDRPDPRLAGLIAGLVDQEPGRDLWPGISSRLAPRRPGTLILRWPTALAAGLALVAGTAALMTVLQQRSGPNGMVADSGVMPGASSAPVLPAGFDAATGTLQAAIDDLERTLASHTASLDPITRQRVGEAIASLDEAIGDARRQAVDAPTDVGAARYFTRTLQRKLGMLQTVATMTSRS